MSRQLNLFADLQAYLRRVAYMCMCSASQDTEQFSTVHVCVYRSPE